MVANIQNNLRNDNWSVIFVQSVLNITADLHKDFGSNHIGITLQLR
jgi:hypothetical protein